MSRPQHFDSSESCSAFHAGITLAAPLLAGHAQLHTSSHLNRTGILSCSQAAYTPHSEPTELPSTPAAAPWPFCFPARPPWRDTPAPAASPSASSPPAAPARRRPLRQLGKGPPARRRPAGPAPALIAPPARSAAAGPPSLGTPGGRWLHSRHPAGHPSVSQGQLLILYLSATCCGLFSGQLLACISDSLFTDKHW